MVAVLAHFTRYAQVQRAVSTRLTLRNFHNVWTSNVHCDGKNGAAAAAIPLKPRSTNLTTFPQAHQSTHAKPSKASPPVQGPGNTVPLFISHQDAIEEIFTQHREQERPFYVTDLGNVSRQYNRWTHNLPGVRPFYAVKCNPDPLILETLKSQGAGFDCATSAEMELALSSGCPPEDVIFANPIKSLSDIAFARAKGVKKMTFDNAEELHKIQSVFPDAEVVLRLLPDDSGSLMRFGSKFGADEAVVADLLSLAQVLNLKVIGVSFHIGSGCFDPTKYRDALQLSRRVFDKAVEMGLPPMYFLDVGGGFPGGPADSTDEIPFENFASVIRDAMSECFPEDRFPNVQKISEPGRYFASHSAVLFTKVTGKRVQSAKEDDSKRVMYYINDGVYGSFNCIMFDHYNPLPIPAVEFLQQKRAVASRAIQLHSPSFGAFHTAHAADAAPASPAAAAVRSFGYGTATKTRTLGTFFGPTCDSMDKICTDFPISELSVGDWVAFDSMGAYTSAAASRFNGCELAQVKHCHSLSA